MYVIVCVCLKCIQTLRLYGYCALLITKKKQNRFTHPQKRTKADKNTYCVFQPSCFTKPNVTIIFEVKQAELI